MSKEYQEVEIEFRLDTFDDNGKYPSIRGIIVYQYGGTIEECIANARKKLDLNDDWVVVKAEE